MVDKLYRLIFSTSITVAVRQFLANLRWSFLGGGVFAAVLLVTNILAGRMMGPESFGKFNLAYSLAQVFLISIYLGLNIAIVRTLAGESDRKQQNKIISTAMVFILAMLLIFSVIYLLVYQAAATRFALESILLFSALIFMIALTAKSLFDHIVRGLRQFRIQFNSKIIESALILLAFFGWFFLLKRNHYSDYLYVLTIGAFGAALYYLWRLKDRFSRFDWSVLRRLLSEAKFYFITTVVGTLFMFVDKLVIAKYLQFSELGLYSAYYNASILLVAQASLLFINVFLPTISGLAPKILNRKIDRLFYRTSPLVFLLIGIFVIVVLKLFGEGYQLNFVYVASFAAVAALQVFVEIYNAYIINLSIEAYKKFVFFGNSLVLGGMILYLPMIKYGLVSIQNILYLYLLITAGALVIQKIIIKQYARA